MVPSSVRQRLDLLVVAAAALGLVLGLAWFVGRDVDVPEIAPLVRNGSLALQADAELRLEPPTARAERTAIVLEPIEPLKSFDGIVTDRAGSPIAGATVELYESPPGLGTRVTRAVATTDAAGRFSLAGEISFLPWAGLHASAPGVDRRVLEVRLTRPNAAWNAGGTVRGRAVHDGKPWRHEVAWQLGELGGKAAVRGDGSFELRNVPAGEVRVFATRHASAAPCEARVLVEPDSVNFVELAWD